MIRSQSIISCGRRAKRNEDSDRKGDSRAVKGSFVHERRSIGRSLGLWRRPTLAPPRPVYLFCSDQGSTLAEPQLLFSLAPGPAASANSFFLSSLILSLLPLTHFSLSLLSLIFLSLTVSFSFFLARDLTSLFFSTGWRLS